MENIFQGGNPVGLRKASGGWYLQHEGGRAGRRKAGAWAWRGGGMAGTVLGAGAGEGEWCGKLRRVRRSHPQ
jgi:hypothetical protein